MAQASWWSRLTGRLGGKRQGHALGEDDAPADTGVAASRPTGGDPEAAYGEADDGDPGDSPKDLHSTTGTSPSETFVGRAGGQDEGYAGTTGAEVRGEAARQADGATNVAPGVDGRPSADH